METIFLEPVAGKPGVFLATVAGVAAVWAYRKEEFDAKDKLKTVQFRNEHVAAAKAVAAKLKLPVYMAVEVEMAGEPWASYAVPVARVSFSVSWFLRWHFLFSRNCDVGFGHIPGHNSKGRLPLGGLLLLCGPFKHGVAGAVAPTNPPRAGK